MIWPPNLLLKKRSDGWWIVGTAGGVDCGPYRFKVEADTDRRALARTYSLKGVRKWWEKEFKQDQILMQRFEQLCKETLKQGHKRSVRLARLADKQGMTPTDCAKYPDLLDTIDLEPEDVTQHVLHHANEIHQQYSLFVRSINKKHEPKTKAPELVSGPVEEGAKRFKILGHPATAVIRWLGKEGYSFPETMKLLGKLGVDLAESTVKIQLKAGKNGERGEPASISKRQSDQIFDLIDS